MTEDSHVLVLSVLENGLIALVNKLHHDAKSTPSFDSFSEDEYAVTLQPLSIARALWKSMMALDKYRGAQNGAQNIRKKDPGRARQSR